MRARFILVAALLCAATTAFAQERADVTKTFSVEVGTGISPLYMLDTPSRPVQKRLAQKNLVALDEGCFHPVLTLTGVLRTGVKSEFTITAGTSWNHNKLIKCPVFGIDPLGQPRLNVEEGTPAGTLESSPEFSLLFQYRHLWNPQNALVCYSGIGAGFSTAMGFYPIPSFTPLALRLGGEHIYGFVEGTVSILATFVHGGLGWRF
ncbi:MAG: hypothetical protein J6Y88_00685 [Bacteroidales bacterium]|nr:hypothetical protein [Bacteroidales bacterium]